MCSRKASSWTKRDVIEQDKVLVKLTHVADVRHHGHAESFAKQTDGKKFADASDAHSDDRRIERAHRFVRSSLPFFLQPQDRAVVIPEDRPGHSDVHQRPAGQDLFGAI